MPKPLKPKPGTLRFILSCIRPYRWQFIVALLAIFGTSAAVLGMGAGLKYLIDEGLASGDQTRLNHYFIVLLSIIIVLGMASYVRVLCSAWVGERVVADIRSKVYTHLVTLTPEFFEAQRTGELVSRLSTDTTLLQTVVTGSVPMALRNIILLFGGTTMLLFTSTRLTEYVLLAIPLVVVPIVFLGRKVRVLARSTQDRMADLSAHVEETVTGIRTVQAYGMEPHETRRFDNHSNQALSAALSRVKMRALLTSVVITLIFSAIVGVLCVGSRQVLAGALSHGELSAFIFYSVVVASAVGALSEIAGDLQKAAGAAERLLELLSITPALLEQAAPMALPKPVRGEVAFTHVGFTYPTRPEQPAVRDLTFTAAPGQVVALVGPSGAGKSTIIQLLLRFYDPQHGSVTIDGIDLRHLPLQDVRGAIGLVSQEPAIFSASIRDNIAYGKSGASEAEITDAAKSAAAWEFIATLPHGLDTLVGERGVLLSGGQRQRIALARAILRNPPILLLDEATSALDAENERQVQEALQGLMQGRTTLVIAHRLATVQQADQIIVLNHGGIEAIGTHRQLLKANPLYARLAELQFTAGTL